MRGSLLHYQSMDQNIEVSLNGILDELKLGVNNSKLIFFVF